MSPDSSLFNITRAQALQLVAMSGPFRVFTRNDWSAFSGCTSEEPMICDAAYENEDILIIIDGHVIGLYDAEGNGYQLDTESGYETRY